MAPAVAGRAVLLLVIIPILLLLLLLLQMQRSSRSCSYDEAVGALGEAGALVRVVSVRHEMMRRPDPGSGAAQGRRHNTGWSYSSRRLQVEEAAAGNNWVFFAAGERQVFTGPNPLHHRRRRR